MEVEIDMLPSPQDELMLETLSPIPNPDLHNELEKALERELADMEELRKTLNHLQSLHETQKSLLDEIFHTKLALQKQLEHLGVEGDDLEDVPLESLDLVIEDPDVALDTMLRAQQEHLAAFRDFPVGDDWYSLVRDSEQTSRPESDSESNPSEASSIAVHREKFISAAYEAELEQCRLRGVKRKFNPED